MIKRIWLKNFGPYEAASIDLDQFTVVVGTNAAGKSFVFTALKALGRVAKYPTRSERHSGGYQTRTGQVSLEQIIHKGDLDRTVTLGVEFAGTISGNYEIQLRKWDNPGGVIVAEKLDVKDADGRQFHLAASANGKVEGNAGTTLTDRKLQTPRFLSIPGLLYKSRDPAEQALGRAIQWQLFDGLGVYRLDPTALKSSAALDRNELSATGYHFATYLDRIRNEPGGKEAFEKLLARFRSACPHVTDILLPLEPTEGHGGQQLRKHIHFVMTSSSGASIPADLESDGTVLLLAYMSLVHGSRPHDLLCIEEPENGVHPSAIRTLVSTIQDLSKPNGEVPGAQVLVCTHSAKFVDVVQNTSPQSLRLVRRASDGKSTIESVPQSKFGVLAGWAGLT